MSQKNIYYFKTLDSTMNLASEFADHGCSNCTVVVAEKQNSGRGRMGRVWHSELGGLYFSVIVRLNISVDFSACIGFAIAVDIANTVKNLFHIDARLKWPNDILVHKNKLCGILSYAKTDKSKIVYVNVGVGVNVNNNPSRVETNAISISDILGQKVSKLDILSKFMSSFQNRLINFEVRTVIEEWKQLNVTLGKCVKIITLKDKIEGIANRINSKGGLEVLIKDGSIQTILYGDCFHC